MKIFQLSVSEEYQAYKIKGISLDFVDEFRQSNELSNKWEKLELIKCGEGKKTKIGYCFNPPSSIVISEDMLPIFKNALENEKLEFLPLTYNGEEWYILHSLDCTEIEYEIERDILGNKYFINEKEFINNNINEKNCIKLLGNGVKKKIIAELYTNKMVEFINMLEDVGIEFEEKGETKFI